MDILRDTMKISMGLQLLRGKKNFAKLQQQKNAKVYSFWFASYQYKWNNSIDRIGSIWPHKNTNNNQEKEKGLEFKGQFSMSTSILFLSYTL